MATRLLNFLAWTRNATPAQIVGTILTMIPVVILSLKEWIVILEKLQQFLLTIAGGQPIVLE